VINYTYNHIDYRDFLYGFAKAVGSKVVDDYFDFPPDVGQGYIRLLSLPQGLQAVVSDYTLHTEVMIYRKGAPQEVYNLRFEEIFVPGNLTIEIQDEVIKEKDKVHAGAKLYSTLFDTGYTLSAGTKLRNISILISPEWMSSHMGINTSSEVLQQYLALKSFGFNFEPFDAEYRVLFNEVLDDHSDNPLQKVFIQNRIMLLIEKFFKNLSLKAKDVSLKHSIHLSHKEIDKLMEVETLLIKDFSTPPPTISQLAKTATMSPSKLKSSFRQVYGSGLYEYYQKVRMQKARSLLLSRKYSVKEVGTQLGYTNLSNFALAFKKQFNTLPSKV
jgi:AraC-like DNA-binding protein